MLDYYFNILQIEKSCSLDDLKKAYRKLAKENHPDLFPDESIKRIREMKMIQINEAYQRILSDLEEKNSTGRKQSAIRDNNADNQPETGAEPDKSYALYKLGFNYYSIAVNRKPQKSRIFFSDGHIRTMTEELKDSAALERFRESLKNLRLADTYFTKIILEYPESEWSFDAQEKIKQINRLYKMYMNIIENMNTNIKT